MKPAEHHVSISGNLPGQTTAFTLDPTAAAHLMSIFTRQYSNLELAVLRELSVNAFDSHVMAGNQDPIRVDTPSPLSPYLVIADNGVGLSVDELHGMFSRYGASTKRDSNAVTGSFGIGSKSPLAYTAQFSLVAVKDGVKATVSISLGDDKVGRLTVVDTCATDEPNGVTIRVPVKGSNSFEKEAKDFFQYWQPGDVLVNGRPPKHVEGLRVTDDVLLVAHESPFGRAGSVVLMGNVPYPVDQIIDPSALGTHYRYSIVATVPIGDVDIAPSREALEYTVKTRQRLTEIVQEFRHNISDAVKREVANAPTAPEALKRAYEFGSVTTSVGVPSYMWRGNPLPTNLVTQPPSRMILVNKEGPFTRHQKVTSCDLSVITRAVFVTDYTPDSFTPTHKKKLLQWLYKQPDDVQKSKHFVLTDFAPNPLLVQHTVAWDVVASEKLPSTTSRAVGPSGRIAGSYDIAFGVKNPYRPGVQYKSGVPGQQLDYASPIFYLHGNHITGRELQPILDAEYPSYTIALLPANRLDKFKRDNPQVPEATKHCQLLYKRLTNKLTPTEKLSVMIRDERIERLVVLAAARRNEIKDPAILAVIDALGVNVDTFLQARRRFQNAASSASWNAVLPANPFKRYHLLDRHRFEQCPDETIRYMNNEYEATK